MKVIQKCNINGCDNVSMLDSRGKRRKLCTKHHRAKYKIPNLSGKDRIKSKFVNTECTLCGLTGPCDRHRVIMGKDGGKYIKGNVIILCPNCHRLLHLGKLEIK